MSTPPNSPIGQSVKRREDARFLTAKASTPTTS